ncbi:hypothetical protein RUMOBE_04189 [Blautia obeum ATCC 29174]|jgi:hypothetical protein|uniref:Uncharacterized protein n=1 Tax=Blautia obeum ATCC 29174 TaxID=411459 RepID=A5ZYR9_9FIRM|nr:hypothetical protein RUMOBE_04189 [Blautia obeum ATCC 29174]
MHIYSYSDMHIPTILFENYRKVKKILSKKRLCFYKKSKHTKTIGNALKIT